jgi:hypothetical protein
MNMEQTPLDQEQSTEGVVEPSMRDMLGDALEQAEQRERDDQGRFTQSEKTAQVASKVAAETGTDPAQTDPVEPEITMPASLKREFGDKWKTLPKEVQQFWAEREQVIHQGFTKADEDRTYGKSMKDVITPYEAIIRAEGGTPTEAVRSLLNTAYVLRVGSPEQKVELFSHLMQQYAVAPQDLFNRLQNGAARVDPQVNALQSEIQQIRALLQQQTQSHEQQEEQEVHHTLNSFAQEEGHEHFEAVRYTMGLLLQSGQCKDMQEAYDRAVWADPSIRSTLLDQQIQAGQTKRVADVNARVQQARKAGSSVVGAPGGNASAPAANSPDLRSTLSAAFDDAMG